MPRPTTARYGWTSRCEALHASVQALGWGAPLVQVLSAPRLAGRVELQSRRVGWCGRFQHLVLFEGDVVAQVVIEQVLGLKTNGRLGREIGRAVELEGVGEVALSRV